MSSTRSLSLRPGQGRPAARTAVLTATAAAAWAASSLVARAAPTQRLADVVVTATRIAMPAFDVPASISSVPGADLRDDALGINLAEGVRSVAGLLVRNQYDYAQDQQVSIRGIGAGSAFGVRGVRI